jgi:hypothetical protein
MGQTADNSKVCANTNGARLFEDVDLRTVMTREANLGW